MELRRLNWKVDQEPQSAQDWIDVQSIEKDILLAYHQMIEHGFCTPELDWGHALAIPYWEYLKPTFLNDFQEGFMHEGCCVLILAMAWSKIHQLSWYIDRHVGPIEKGLETFVAMNDNQHRLHNALCLAVSEVKGKALIDASARLRDESNWVLDEFVDGYFVSNTRFIEHKKLRADQFKKSVNSKKKAEERK